MNDDTKIDDVEDDVADAEDAPEFNTVLDADADMSTPARNGVGRGFVLVGFALSALLGAGLGIAGTKMLKGPDTTVALKAEFAQSLAELQKSSDTQTKKLGTANSAQKKTKTRLDRLQAKNEDLVRQIEALELQIADLQTTPNKDIADRLAVIEALSGEGEDMFTGANAIAARLDALEKVVAEAPQILTTDTIEGKSTKDEAETEPVTKNPVSEMPPAEIGEGKSVNATAQEQSPLDILIETFPRQKMLTAVKAQETSRTKKPGWLKRALSKHIKVKDEENIDPYATIDAAETALKNGDITAALSHIAKLNPPIRSSAADWVRAAKKVQSQQ